MAFVGWKLGKPRFEGMAMKRSVGSKWRVSFLAITLAVAAVGASIGWSQNTTSPPVVTPANHQAALDAFRQARTLYQQDKYADSYALNSKGASARSNVDRCEAIAEDSSDKDG